MSTCKITVLRRMYNSDLVKEFSLPDSNTSPCTRFAEGQEFVVEEGQRPAGFCDWAWHDINKVLVPLMRGGDFTPWMSDKDTIIACCTDALKPVVFKVERISD